MSDRSRASKPSRPPIVQPDVTLPGFIGSRLEAHPSFTRGLSLGLLVGAAVAGSTIWGRLRGAGRRRPPRPEG